jgi:hypothetical protein
MPAPSAGIAAALAAVAAGSGAGGAVVGEDEIGAMLSEIVRALDLQLDLPLLAEPPRWWDVSLPAELFWVIVAAILIVLLLGLATYVRDEVLPLLGVNRRRVRRPGETNADGAALAAAVAEAMTGADELARQGRFMEAMHRLLLQALCELRERVAEPFADSLTSREVLRRAKLPLPGQLALHDIVARVELTYFGSRPGDHSDYAACRASFAALAEAFGAGRR